MAGTPSDFGGDFRGDFRGGRCPNPIKAWDPLNPNGPGIFTPPPDGRPSLDTLSPATSAPQLNVAGPFNDHLIGFDAVCGHIMIRSRDWRSFSLYRVIDGMLLGVFGSQAAAQARADQMVTTGEA